MSIATRSDLLISAPSSVPSQDHTQSAMSITLENVIHHICYTFKKYSGEDLNAGELNQEELEKMVRAEFPSLSKQEDGDNMIRTVMAMMDFDGDKSVNFKEFVLFLAFLSVEMQGASK
ncbi:protein S100-G-like isoform X1 [Pleurodeles waltl]|uniref:protein S100-G-like isoform X1 n=1 Tax=Pleurodeles waltl TaxID=8319 RepID=UPI0037095D4D